MPRFMIILIGIALANCSLSQSILATSPVTDGSALPAAGAAPDNQLVIIDSTGVMRSVDAAAAPAEPAVAAEQPMRVAEAAPKAKRARAKSEGRKNPDVTGSVPGGSTRYYTASGRGNYVATGSLSEDVPDVGSPEWQRQQDEAERKEKRLDTMIRGICRGC